MRKDLFLGKSFQVYGPENTDMACEACVYGRGAHAEFCPKRLGPIARALNEAVEEYIAHDSTPLPGGKDS